MDAFYLKPAVKVTQRITVKAIATKIEDVILIEPRVFEDNRGFFMETFNSATFAQAGLPINFVQDNHSLSKEAGTLRGLHYQLNPCAQGKLIRCIRGSILDVAVDIRRDSRTFKKWISETLSAQNKRQLWIPPGFAHGFVTLEPDTEVVYKVTELYSPEHDRSIIWNDSELAVDWSVQSPILSEKDKNGKPLAQADLF